MFSVVRILVSEVQNLDMEDLLVCYVVVLGIRVEICLICLLESWCLMKCLVEFGVE